MQDGRTFGVLSPFVGGDYYGAVIAGVNRAAVAAGDRVLAIQTLDPGAQTADHSGVPDFRHPVGWRHLSGLVVLPGAAGSDYARAAQRAGVPVVTVGHELPGVRCPVVLADNRAGVREAVGHLVTEHGHERIAFAGNLANFDQRERCEGYREALAAHGIAAAAELVFDAPDNHETGGASAAEWLIRSGKRATAVITGTDRNAIGLLERLTSAGWSLPRDVAVVGFDDIADGRYARPSLATVRQPLDRLGEAAYDLAAAAAAVAAATAPTATAPTATATTAAAAATTGAAATNVAAAATTAAATTTDPDASSDGGPGARRVPTSFIRRGSCGCPGGALNMSEGELRAQFAQVNHLQMTLNTQYQLGIELLSAREREPRALAWLGRTPALGGCLGLWPDVPDTPATTGSPATTGPAESVTLGPGDPCMEIVGEFRASGSGASGSGASGSRAVGPSPVTVGSVIPVSAFPPPALFALADGPAGEIVFVVPVRDPLRDWGMLAAVGRIQDSTPPGREVMNHSGALLAAALDHDAMLRSLREKEERLSNAALHDHLTGLPNRALLADRLSQAAQRAIREPGHRFAVLLLDLDGFKVVNDTLGHAAGDRLLVHVAGRLTAALRGSDTAARLGGDEFVVLLDGVTLPDGPQIVADRIRVACTEPMLIDGHRISIGASVGVALSADGSADPDVLLREADAAMYEAKMRHRAAL